MLEPSSSEEEDYDTNQKVDGKHGGKFAASHLNNTQLFNYHFQQQQLKQQQSNVVNASNVSNLSSTLPTQQTKQPPIVSDTTATQFSNSPVSNSPKLITNVPRTSISNSTVQTNQSSTLYSTTSTGVDDQFSKNKPCNYSNISAQPSSTQIQPTQQTQNVESPVSRTGSIRLANNRRRSIISQQQFPINETVQQQHQVLAATSSDVLPIAGTQQVPTSNVMNAASVQHQPLITQQHTISQQQIINKQTNLLPSTNVINAGHQVAGVIVGTDVVGGTNNINLAQQQTTSNQIVVQMNTQMTTTNQITTSTQINPQQMNTGAQVALAIANSSGINCLGNYPMLVNVSHQTDGQLKAPSQHDYNNNNPFNSITLAMIKQNSTNSAGSVGLGNQGSLTNSTNLLPNLPAIAEQQQQQPNTAIDEQIALEREEQQHKIALQLYVFVVRCVSYPFNAKQATDMPRRAFKVNEAQLDLIKTRIKSLVKGELTISSVLASSKSKNSLYSGSNAIASTSSGSFATAASATQSNSYVNSPICEKLLLDTLSIYNEHFLSSDRLDMLVRSGGCCLTDFRYIFRKLAEKKVKRSIEIDTYNKEPVLNSFMMKFDLILPSEDQTYTQHYGNYLYYFVSNKKFTTATGKASQYQIQQQNFQQTNADVVLTKEQMYDIFSRILSIKKFEHQLLFNALQVSFTLF